MTKTNLDLNDLIKKTNSVLNEIELLKCFNADDEVTKKFLENRKAEAILNLEQRFALLCIAAPDQVSELFRKNHPNL